MASFRLVGTFSGFGFYPRL